MESIVGSRGVGSVSCRHQSEAVCVWGRDKKRAHEPCALCTATNKRAMRERGAAALMAGCCAGLVVAAGVAVENLAFRRLAAALRTVIVRAAAFVGTAAVAVFFVVVVFVL